MSINNGLIIKKVWIFENILLSLSLCFLAILRRANKRKQEIIATDEITEETVHAEMDGALLHEDEMQRIELANGSVTVSSLDLEQAINAFNAGQGQIFSMSDFAIQAVSMTD